MKRNAYKSTWRFCAECGVAAWSGKETALGVGICSEQSSRLTLVG